MAKQHHYVVVYEEDTGKWFLDVETTMAKFDDIAVFETDNNTWHNFRESEDLREFYLDRELELACLLDDYNPKDSEE